MTEQINDQISAFIDDELSEEECALLVRRFERDTESRNQVLRYTMIGAALRGELLQPDAVVLRRRLAGALTGAPLPATRVSARWSANYARPLLGFGVAATVAVVAIVGLRSLNDARLPNAAGSPAPVVIQAREWVEPPSYVVPQDIADQRALTPPIRLTNYVVRHGEYASHLNRTSVHSNVVGATKDDAVVAEEIPSTPAARQ
jgi:sigma-E factor negative regulatory protein RseA